MDLIITLGACKKQVIMLHALTCTSYGFDDELGALNRLTDDVVKNAAQEIKSGTRISMNWPLDAQEVPFFGRQAFHKEILHKSPRAGKLIRPTDELVY